MDIPYGKCEHIREEEEERNHIFLPESHRLLLNNTQYVYAVVVLVVEC